MYRILFIGLLAAYSARGAVTENGFEIVASYDALARTVEIRWKNKELQANLFILQKSSDQVEWTNLDTLYHAADFNEQLIIWEDRNPVPGGCLYRLMTVVDENNYSLSRPVYVEVNKATYAWTNIPSYQKSLLKLYYTGTGTIGGVINLFIQTRSGKVLLRSRFSSFTNYIEVPVDNLGKGNYYISMFVEGELIWRERFVK